MVWHSWYAASLSELFANSSTKFGFIVVIIREGICPKVLLGYLPHWGSGSVDLDLA